MVTIHTKYSDNSTCGKPYTGANSDYARTDTKSDGHARSNT
jgi:hypothetical protein